MLTQPVSLSEMLNQSIAVLTQPSVATFERFEKHGTLRDGLIYVAIAGAIGGLVALVVNLFFAGPVGAIISALGAIILPIVGFLIFSFVLYYVGKQQGGTGTQDEVIYTCALYTAPILAINGAVGNIPLLGCLFAPVALALGLYQLYLGYLAARSSMNLEQNPAIITVVAAILAQWVVGFGIAFVIGIIAVGLGVGTELLGQ